MRIIQQNKKLENGSSISIIPLKDIILGLIPNETFGGYSTKSGLSIPASLLKDLSSEEKIIVTDTRDNRPNIIKSDRIAIYVRGCSWVIERWMIKKIL